MVGDSVMYYLICVCFAKSIRKKRNTSQNKSQLIKISMQICSEINKMRGQSTDL